MHRVLKHTAAGIYIASLGDVEEVNLVQMARLMQDDGATGVVYDTTDEDRVQRLISAPHKYWRRQNVVPYPPPTAEDR